MIKELFSSEKHFPKLEEKTERQRLVHFGGSSEQFSPTKASRLKLHGWKFKLEFPTRKMGGKWIGQVEPGNGFSENEETEQTYNFPWPEMAKGVMQRNADEKKK